MLKSWWVVVIGVFGGGVAAVLAFTEVTERLQISPWWIAAPIGVGLLAAPYLAWREERRRRRNAERESARLRNDLSLAKRRASTAEAELGSARTLLAAREPQIVALQEGTSSGTSIPPGESERSELGQNDARGGEPSVPTGSRLERMCHVVRELDAAVTAVVAVSNRIRAEYARLPAEVYDSSRTEVVTPTDRWSNRELLESLGKSNKQNGTQYGVISEEDDLQRELSELRARVVDHGRCWVVDPLDASSAFLQRADPAAPSVMVALVDQAGRGRRHRDGIRVLLGVVHFPMTGEWYYAVRGRGAFRDDIRLSRPAQTPRLESCLVSLNWYAEWRHETDAFKKLQAGLRGSKETRAAAGARLVTVDVPHSGIAMRVIDPRYGVAAAVHDNQGTLGGPRDLGHPPKQCPWDVCAPKIIVEEAGGAFVGIDGRAYDPFGEPGLIVVAQPPELAADILRLLGN